jgi:hypothetical protein
MKIWNFMTPPRDFSTEEQKVVLGKELKDSLIVLFVLVPSIIHTIFTIRWGSDWSIAIPILRFFIGDRIPGSLASPLLEKCRKGLAHGLGIKGPGHGYTSICLIKLRHLGNQFVTITIALLACQMFGIPRVMIPNGSVLLRRNFMTDLGIWVEILQNKCPKSRDVLHLDYMWQLGLDKCPSSLMYRIAASFRNEVIASIPTPQINDSTLVLHMRALEIFIFKKGLTPLYGQPTCSFYLGAMQRNLGHNNVLLIAGDRGNVCTQPCEAQGAVVRVGRKMSEDFAIMLFAKRLVLSRSTVMRAVMFLSPVTKIWYSFGSSKMPDAGKDGTALSIWPCLGPHYICIPSQEVENVLAFRWGASKVPLLLKEKCRWYLDSGILINSGTDTLKFPWDTVRVST